MDTLPALAFDHLAIAAGRLGEGIDLVEEKLGVRMPLGGKHPGMNTHNAVMKLGEGLYLEVIAIDPEAPPPARARWFGLDDPKLQHRLSSLGPCLVAWVARSENLQMSLRASTVDLGPAIPMSRGSLSWNIAVRTDGSLAMGGLMPALIQWPPGVHPTAQRMPDLGVRFAGLTLRAAKPEPVRAALAQIGAAGLVEVKSFRRGMDMLEAVFVRPDGLEAVIGGGDMG